MDLETRTLNVVPIDLSKLRSHALMYHDVVSGVADTSGFRGPAAHRYKLSWKDFIAHLDGIQRSTERPPSVVEDLLAGRDRLSWLLTFDDGGASLSNVGEELARRKWRGHFFITTDFVGERGFLDPPAILELRRMGHVIGSHSASHPVRMSSLSRSDLLAEWRTSAQQLSELLDERITTASVPGGHYSKRVAEAAREAGITTVFTSEPVRRPRWVGECLVVGRLSVRRSTSVREAAMAAAGRSSPWLRQYMAWNLRKPLKAIGGERYEWLLDRLRGPSDRISQS